MRHILSVMSALCIVLAAGSTAAADRLQVFVSVVPQKYFVQQIGKDLVDVHVMVRPGASPATYEPKPAQMAALSGADLYFSVGVPFENFWLDKIRSANPKMRLVPTDKGIEKLAMAAHHHDDDHGQKEAGHHEKEESHGHGHHPGEEQDHPGEAGHNGLDPHIWLSPALVKLQVDAMAMALGEADPGNRTVYAANALAFKTELDRLDQALHQLFKGQKGLRFMVFHPSWGYFARDYNLVQVAIEIEGKDPKPAQLKALIEQARENQIRVIFVQPQFSSKSAKIVAREIAGEVVFADPLALDWMANMRAVAQKFKEALK